MILYFSGTGNSRYIAQMLGDILKDEIHSLSGELRQNSAGSFNSENPYIFVFPIYAWGMPRVVEKLLRSSSFSGCRQAYFIGTCGHWSGNTAKDMRRVCRRKSLEYKGFTTILMPSNYIAIYSPPEPDRCLEIVEAAQETLKKAAECIRAGEILPPEKHQLKERLFSKPGNALFYALAVKDDGFQVTETCNACGTCERLCPLANITIKDRKPDWGGTCTHCMACICHCPKEAIQYKGRTDGRRRYRLGDYSG